EALAGAVGGDTGFHRVDLRFTHVSRGFSATSGVTFGRDRTSDDTSSLTDRSLRARSSVTLRAGEALDVRFGVEARLNDIQLRVAPDRLDRSDLIDLFPTRTDHALGGFIGLSYHPYRALSIEPGVRADLYSSRGEHAGSLDPRLAVTARLSRR